MCSVWRLIGARKWEVVTILICVQEGSLQGRAAVDVFRVFQIEGVGNRSLEDPHTWIHVLSPPPLSTLILVLSYMNESILKCAFCV